MNTLFKYVRSGIFHAFALAFILLLSIVAGAVEEPYSNALKGSQVAVGNSFVVSDEKFNDTASWNKIYHNISVDNIISFEINFDTTIHFYNTPFHATITFKIYIYDNELDTSEVSDSMTYSSISLNLRYDTVTGKAYNGVAMFKFKDAHKYRVKILSITSPELGTIPPIFRVKGQIIVNRKYKFETTSTDVTRHSILNGNQLQLQWTPTLYPGAEMFDVEYTFVDKHSEAGITILTMGVGSVPPSIVSGWFRNNSTRITTSASSYIFNIPYDSGYVLFRIRGAQIHPDENIRWEGDWNYTSQEAEEYPAGVASSSGIVMFNGHEQNLNWQLTINFAEEGKRKEVISYFDGSLRNRQSVTISNTDNKSVIQETVYDDLGRAAASILPAPTTDSTIHYFRGFNLNPASEPYSFADLLYGSTCGTVADSISSESGTGRYYSTNNPFLGAYAHAKYVPNAEGYPLAVTEYMADNTGRIKAQGGVGPTFQLGSGHETKYFYGKPTQTELDRLFGAEAGNASHYLKNMVQDANGQVSVSYQDASGKTIATALAGGTPAMLHSLASNGETTAVAISDDLISASDFVRNPSDYSLTATATFLAPGTGDYIFEYKVQPLVYQKRFGPAKDSLICSNCYYDLEVIIKDDCNNLLGNKFVSAGSFFDTTCATPPALIQDTIGVNISKVGEYYVTYVLRVSQDALDFYDSTHLVKNSDIKTINHFLLKELKETDFYGCYNNCESCFDKLGTSAEFVINFKSLFISDSMAFRTEDSLWVLTLYDSLYANCQSIQSACPTNICDEKLALLKMDISPGGQYALYDSAYNLLEIPVNVLAMRSSIIHFPDGFGGIDSVEYYEVIGDDTSLVKIPVSSLNDSMFIKYWKAEWADSLVKLHPEYCYYLWCLANSGSYEFDRKVEDLLDVDTAIANEWFDPEMYHKLLDADPFFTAPGASGRYNKMKENLRTYSYDYMKNSQPTKDILQFVDIILYCKTQYNGWSSCNPDVECRSRNREWFFYKTFYLNLKQKYYEEARRDDPEFETCTNCKIGEDLSGDVDSIVLCRDIPTSNFVFEKIGSSPEFCVTMRFLHITSLSGALANSYVLTFRAINEGDTTLFDLPFPAGIAKTVNYPDNCLPYIYNSMYWETHMPELISVSCVGGVLPFTDTTCNIYCPAGVYTPYDNDSISYFIQYGHPDSTITGVPPGYGNCKFYPVFDLFTAVDSSCRFFNVWVCIYDSTCDGVCPGDTIMSSYCPASTGSDTLYHNKQRRYPEYLNLDDLLDDISSNNPQQPAEAQENLIIEQCVSNCEAQADYWLRVLSRCEIGADSTVLRATLIDICSRGCSISTPFGASSIPSNITATYHSFEEAIEGILGPGALNDSCTAELLAMPYPYDKQPVLTERVILETDYDICQRLGQFRSAYASSGFAGSLHQYMTATYGSSYTLDSTELYDIVNACLNCNGILKNDIVLPVLFDPQSKPCLACDSVTVAYTAFTEKFPAITSDDDDYEILFANFFNHRFGFALIYYKYKEFLDSCTSNGLYASLLCNTAVTADINLNDFGCVAELYGTASTNATSAYIAYIDSVRKDFREAWLTKCMNVQPVLTMNADLYEYHYTLYYYDQSGNLVRTVPPEGVELLDDNDIEDLQAVRAGTNPHCSNNNAILFTNGSLNFAGGTSNAPQLNAGSGEISIETWINLSSYANQGVLSNNHYNSTGSYNHGYSLAINSNKLALHLGESNSTDKLEAVSPVLAAYLPLNTWVHVVVQRTSINTVRMFIDGNEVPVTYLSNAPVSGNIDHAGTDPLYIGASNKDGSVSKLSAGLLRHVRIYKRALLPAEIRQNAMDYCGNPSSFGGLVFWATLNEGSWTPSGGNDYLYDRIYNNTGQKIGDVAFETSTNTDLVPAHRLVTSYQYNSLNQVVQQYSPDGDSSWFFYDRLGRLAVSQNKEQKDNSSYSGASNRFSYTKYDPLGRIKEVGEKSEADDDIRAINMLDTTEVKDWLASGSDRQITKTLYDDPVNLYQDAGASRKRVVASIYLEEADDTEGDSTLYAYDISGNVKTLVQHVKTLVAEDATNGKKRIDYDYDLVSGKVNMVSYQPDKGDQFFYKYAYDADNRITRSYSSRDRLVWTEDASYNYYLHGPLARLERGHYKVQGVDYAYTLQGWLKGINSDSLSHLYDMMNDGKQGTDYARVSRDVYGFKIGYYTGDYTAVGVSANAFTAKPYAAPVDLEATGNQLFNGNISFTTLALSKIGGTATIGYTYGYDQLNRLVEMRQHTTTGVAWRSANILEAYAESIAYDANGNILKYLRKGANISGAPLDMDSLSYKYNSGLTANIINNRLNHVRDQVSSGNYTVDIDNQSVNNYTYDKIGNLKTDVAEGISDIDWTVYGKIHSITKPASSIDYGYDPTGNRIYKKVITNGEIFDEVVSTWYIRDGQGNTLAVYSKRNSAAIKWDEQHLYGSSRLGMVRVDTTVPESPPVVQESPVYDSLLLGSRVYELTNHLGNVLATITDKKVGNDSSGVVNYYVAEVISQNDYYPFGMVTPGRIYGINGRHGFNGKEQDDEIKGISNSINMGARVYDSRLARFLSVDQHASSYPNVSSYTFGLNNPLISIDPDGRDVHIVIGDIPIGTTTIRLIGSEDITGAPAEIQVNLYKMTVTDDVTGKTTEYYVTRDAPIINQKDPVDEQIMPSWLGGDESYNVTNTSFEPRGNNKYNLVSTTTAGEGAYALRTKSGSEELPAEPNNSPFRKKEDIATGVMIHVGGVYTAPDGTTRTTGSEGCFTLQGKDAGNKGIQALVKDINERKAANKKAGKGTKVNLEIKKRKDVKKEWTVDADGTEGN